MILFPEKKTKISKIPLKIPEKIESEDKLMMTHTYKQEAIYVDFDINLVSMELNNKVTGVQNYRLDKLKEIAKKLDIKIKGNPKKEFLVNAIKEKYYK